ncbi:RES family NAD+ phosphorylase [Micromonospora arida]|uniref:RES family NAD+ phosphorylase n=1 Tax=Micromonospora arida TaxID=2203715 RepID=UPI003CF2FC93
MTPHRPPTRLLTPHHTTIPAGTQLFRLHRVAFEASSFNTKMADAYFGGGRFDGIAEDDPYPFLYAGGQASTAVAEVLLRSISANEDGFRLLPMASVEGRMCSTVELTAPVELITLETARDLGAIGQDDWLVQAEPSEYAQTRAWGRWLRRCSPAAGILWQSRRDRPQRAMVFFGDRCPPDLFKVRSPGPGRLDSPAGLAWLNDLLRDYRAAVMAPSPRW